VRWFRRRKLPNELAWSCHFCGAVRLDQYISVVKRERTLAGGVVMTENRRYCNDSAECRRKATIWSAPEHMGA
jgi:hypothetical protein